MFATKILVASALAAGSLAFAAKPAQAAHFSIGIGIPAPVVYCSPAPVVTYYTPAPAYYTAPTYYTPTYAPAYCPAPVVYDRDDYRRPDFFLRFNFGGRHDDHHDRGDFRHDRR